MAGQLLARGNDRELIGAAGPADGSDATAGPGSGIEFDRDVVPLLEPLYRHALRLTRSHADAEDLLQETALKAYTGRQSFLPGTNLKAWLFRIMTNAFISGYRRSKRAPTEFPAGEVTDRQLLASASHRPMGLQSAEDQALAMLPDSHIKTAMAGLPEQFRVAVYFADVIGHSYKEIAAMLGIRQGTVSSRLNRGRQQLRNLLVAGSDAQP